MSWIFIALAFTVPIALYATLDTLIGLLDGIFTRLAALIGRASQAWHGVDQRRRDKRDQQRLLSLRWPLELTPLEFEIWCRDYLEARGWEVGLMPASGFESAPQTEQRPMWLLARRKERCLLLYCPKAPPASGIAEIPGFAARAQALGAELALVVTAVQRPPAFMRAALRYGVRVMHYRDLGRVAY